MTTEQPKAYLDATNIQVAAYARNEFRISVPAETTRDDIKREDFWRSVAERMHVSDKLEIIADDLSWYSEWLVTAVDRRWLRVKELSYIVIDGSELAHASETDEFTVVHRGPKGWSVKRKSDAAILVENLPARSDAEKWVDNHYKARAA